MAGGLTSTSSCIFVKDVLGGGVVLVGRHYEKCSIIFSMEGFKFFWKILTWCTSTVTTDIMSPYFRHMNDSYTLGRLEDYDGMAGYRVICSARCCRVANLHERMWVFDTGQS